MTSSEASVIQALDIKEVFKTCGVSVGQAQDETAATGVTVMLAPQGVVAGIDVRGGGPASRDTRLLDPLAAAEHVHAIVLAGGSAFGLDAAGGVMCFLEEHDVGLDVGVPGVKVPLVCQSDIFDLGVGHAQVRPDAHMAYAACEAAWNHPGGGNFAEGARGAGCGATVGKLRGMAGACAAGIGAAAVQVGPLQVGALVAVNALGDVVDPATGATLAGLRGEDGAFVDSVCELARSYYQAACSGANADEEAGGVSVNAGAAGEGAGGAAATPREIAASFSSGAVTNTTIGIIFTNAALSKAQLCKVASMGHDGMARAVRPIHTSMDGDTLYAISGADVPAPLDVVGALAAEVVARAIVRVAIMR